MNEFSEKDQLAGGAGGQSPGDEAAEPARARQEAASEADDPRRQPAGYWSGSSGQGAGQASPQDRPGWNSGGHGSENTGSYDTRQSLPPQYGAQNPQAGRQQGWANAPYAPPYHTQNPPPYPGGYNRGYGYHGQDPGQNESRQYGTSSGWQQPPPPDKYEWKFEDYDELDAKREKKKRNRGLTVFTVALLCVLSVGLVVLAGVSVYTAAIGQAEAGGADGEPAEAESSFAENPAAELQIAARPEISESLPVGGKMTIPQVCEAVLPSVVGVIRYDNNNLQEITGLGSGIVMSEDGYIITNAHVVAQGTSFKVQLYNGDPYDAVRIGYDTLSDLAVLKIEATGLTPAQFGDSENIKVGETVVAIGNPAGLELAGSVTRGIISALNREVRNINNMTYIQTDAAINPGNSGGALANEYGQVIGINSNKIVAEGYEGIGFAIPITAAKPIIDDLIVNGRVTGRAVLGISCKAIDAVDARIYGERGIYIATIHQDSDLLKNGVVEGDIITHIEGRRVYTLADVRTILDGMKVGDTVTLTIYRRVVNQEINFEVQTKLMENE